MQLRDAHRITSTSDVGTIYEETAADVDLIDEEAAVVKDNQDDSQVS